MLRTAETVETMTKDVAPNLLTEQIKDNCEMKGRIEANDCALEGSIL